MFTPALRCECAQPAIDRLMRKWCIGIDSMVSPVTDDELSIVDHIYTKSL